MTFIIAIVLTLIIKAFFLQAFYIPTGSMQKTLEINDHILVNRLVPKYMQLKRGDVVVFKDTLQWLENNNKNLLSSSFNDYDNNHLGWIKKIGIFTGLISDNSINYLVKRVIGLPGDYVSCCSYEGLLQINGTNVIEKYLSFNSQPSVEKFHIYVPKGKIWVMGDNRDYSSDSRAHLIDIERAFIDLNNIHGRVIAIIYPLNRINYKNINILL